MNGRLVEDPKTYIHRIGRGGRFGTEAIALTIYDRDIDKEMLDNIAGQYKIEDKIMELKGADHLK